MYGYKFAVYFFKTVFLEGYSVYILTVPDFYLTNLTSILHKTDLKTDAMESQNFTAFLSFTMYLKGSSNYFSALSGNFNYLNEPLFLLSLPSFSVKTFTAVSLYSFCLKAIKNAKTSLAQCLTSRKPFLFREPNNIPAFVERLLFSTS